MFCWGKDKPWLFWEKDGILLRSFCDIRKNKRTAAILAAARQQRAMNRDTTVKETANILRSICLFRDFGLQGKGRISLKFFCVSIFAPPFGRSTVNYRGRTSFALIF